jgi:hypothetical protein
MSTIDFLTLLFVGFCVGFYFGMLIMALAQMRARDDGNGGQGADDAGAQGEGEAHEDTLLRLRCYNATLERMTDHLEKMAARYD